MSGDRPVRQKVRFVLNGERVELARVDPNQTLLRYLREVQALTGTKEGCAEGDCGACTIIVADTDGFSGRLRARAVNACIALLPTLDGKEIVTVEGLSGDTLHPVQRAMVDWHGSQCGFCTPGFVMSLFALYKNNASPSRQDIDDALAGNLCRCTGYQPIVKAAQSMYDGKVTCDDWRVAVAGSAPGNDEAARIATLQSLASDESLEIECNGRWFHAPRSLDELADLLGRYPDATLLAGGTDVGLWITKDLRQFDRIIYTGGVRELLTVSDTEAFIDIGAGVTLTDAMDTIVASYPALEELFLRFASPPIRNAGTLGGNIANGSPIGDAMPALMALDTELLLRQGSNHRTVALDDFYLGYRQTALGDGEFVERIRIPHAREGEQVASYKVAKRFDQDISAVCGAFRIRLADGMVDDIRIAYGGMAAVPRRATHTEAALIRQPWQSAALGTAFTGFDEDFEPISDMRASAAYRREVGRNLLRRFLLETTGEQSTTVYRYER